MKEAVPTTSQWVCALSTLNATLTAAAPCVCVCVCAAAAVQVMKKDSEKNMSLKKLWK